MDERHDQEDMEFIIPLQGIRVIDCGIYHAGPGALAILGDLGAEVIKIEQPGIGDPIRRQKMIGSIPFELPGGRNLFCEGANRNKKSVTLNLHSEKGQEILYRLVEHSDVFLTNMRNPAIEKMKIAYPALHSVNPKLIYAKVSAFGPKGPDRDKGGFDYQGQARSGFMYAIGEEDMPPLVSQFGIIDQATAIMASHQLITALYMRERYGIGQEIEVSILGTSIFLQYFNALIAQMGEFDPPRHTRRSEQPMRNYYKCADGRWLMMTLTPQKRHWGPLCRALGRPELEEDSRFDTDEKRFRNAKELIRIFDEEFRLRPLEEWLKIFEIFDLFGCAVNTIRDIDKDPQVLENDYLVDFIHPTLGKIKIPGYPGHFSRGRVGTATSAPVLGEHTEEVLHDVCCFSAEEIKAFREQGII